jgi:hypothetical protein
MSNKADKKNFKKFPVKIFCFTFPVRGWIFIYLKGGVEKFLVGCKQHHSVTFRQGLGVWVKTFHTK